jgi:hypothetical protein
VAKPTHRGIPLKLTIGFAEIGLRRVSQKFKFETLSGSTLRGDAASEQQPDNLNNEFVERI